MKLPEQFPGSGEPAGHKVVNRLPPRIRQFLAQIGNFAVRPHPKFSGIRFNYAAQQFEEGGFAGSVSPQQTYPLTRGYSQGNPVQQNLVAKSEMDVGESEQGHTGLEP